MWWGVRESVGSVGLCEGSVRESVGLCGGV